MAVIVSVTFCGGCGYFRKVQMLEHELNEKIPGQSFTFNSQSNAMITGEFEVEVGGELIHSKKNGDGFVDTAAKLDKIVAAIQAKQ